MGVLRSDWIVLFVKPLIAKFNLCSWYTMDDLAIAHWFCCWPAPPFAWLLRITVL